MRWLVASDSHGDRDSLVRMVQRERAEAPLSGLLYLGDGLSDVSAVEKMLTDVYRVRGNCDFFGAQEEMTVTLAGTDILLCHGHRWQVKTGADRLIYRAMETGARAALYGHTHRPDLRWTHGVLLLNPGAACLGRYAVLTIGPGGLPDAQLRALDQDYAN